MTNKLSLAKDLENYKDEDIDDLLSKLTEEELEELNNDIDPDNQLLPPSQRCRDQTKKSPTGKFDREALIRFIEEKSKQEKDWEKNIPFESKMRGKVFSSKTVDTHISKKELEDMGFDMEFDNEFDEVLKNATEEELVDLAAVLGFNGMLNQTQYHASLDNKEQSCGGFLGVAKSEIFKVVPNEPDNNTDIEEVITKLTNNNPETTEVNLNNLKEITADQVKRLCDAVKKNKILKKLQCANIQLRNAACDSLVDMLKANDTLETLNLESNHLNGDTILLLIGAINRESSGLRELRLANQQQKVLGVRVEQEITRLVHDNTTLHVLGIDLETAEARIRVRDHLVHNVDRLTRQSRVATGHK